MSIKFMQMKSRIMGKMSFSLMVSEGLCTRSKFGENMIVSNVLLKTLIFSI